jgi:hypothetical protein
LEFTESLISYLDSSIQLAAAQAGAMYVDISQALYGHRLCEGPDVAMNGLTAGTDTGPIGRESFHPNALGNQLIAQTILSKTHNFSRFETALPNPADTRQLLEAPQTGRSINDFTPVDNISYPSVQPGAYTPVKLDGQELGLKPATTYEVKLDGAVVALARTDSNAQMSVAIQIPSDISLGGHILGVAGQDQGGGTADINQLVYIVSPDGEPAHNLSIKIDSLSVSG